MTLDELKALAVANGVPPMTVERAADDLTGPDRAAWLKQEEEHEELAFWDILIQTAFSRKAHILCAERYVAYARRHNVRLKRISGFEELVVDLKSWDE